MLYIVAFFYFIDWLSPSLEGLSPLVSNLLLSVAVSAIGILIGTTIHHFFREKRLFFGTFLWLTVYLLAVLITMLIMLRGTEAFDAFSYFFLWFMVIPVLTGLPVSFLLYKKDYAPPAEKEEDKPWKQYTQRR